jgi:hypothetical protein
LRWLVYLAPPLPLQVVGIFCDLTNAVGCVNHDILIEKFKYYGVNETAIDWIKFYLHNRRQKLTSMLIIFKITPLHGR